MAKRRKLAKENNSQLLDESENEYRDTGTVTLNSNNVGEIDCKNAISDYESSDDSILNEFSQVQD